MRSFSRAGITAIVSATLGLIFTLGLLHLGAQRAPGLHRGLLLIGGLFLSAFASATLSAVSLSLFPRRETVCRKCGCILRGISEPRCPECGERI